MQEPGGLKRRMKVWREVSWQPSCFDWTPWPVGCLLSPCLGLICLLSLSGLCLIQAKLSEIQETRAIR